MIVSRLVFASFCTSLAVAGCDSSDPDQGAKADGAETTEPSAPEGLGPGTSDPEPEVTPSDSTDDVEPDPASDGEPAPEPNVNPQPDAPALDPGPSPEQPSNGGMGPLSPIGSAGDGAGGSSPVTSGGASGTSGDPVGGGGNASSTGGCGVAVLCDDFEDDASGMAPGAPWTVDVNGGAVEVSSDRAFSGNNSVLVSNTQGAYKRAFFSVAGDPVFPAAGQEMFGRMMMWLEATPVGSVHWTFIQGEGPSEDASYDVYYRYGGQHEGRLMANFETNGRSTDCWDHSATVMPTQTWACLEWRFDVANDEMQFWLDGTEVSDMHVIGSGEGCVAQDLDGAWPAPTQFEVLRLGWEKYQESSELNAWIDDVAVSTERVGCP